MLISHATADKELIVKLGLLKGLLDTGAVELWCDTASPFVDLIGGKQERLKDIPFGEHWRPELSRIADRVDIVLACWSKAYIAKFRDPKGGVWIRDEILPAHREGRAMHVALEDGLVMPDPFGPAVADEQMSFIFRYQPNSAGLANECRKIVAKAQQEAAPRSHDFDGEFNFDFAALFLDRDRQEGPFLSNSQDAMPTSGLVLVRGRREDDPDALRERLRCVTWPLLPMLNGRSYIAARDEALEGRFASDLEKRLALPLRDGFRKADVQKELDYIGEQLAKFAANVKSVAGERPLENALRRMESAAKADGVAYFAYMVVKPEIWRTRRSHVCETLTRLGEALAKTPSPWLTVLVVLEEEPTVSLLDATKSLWRRLTGPPTPFEGEAGRYPADRPEGALWSQLEPLNPISAEHGGDWGELIQKRLKAPVAVGTHLRETFGEKDLPMSKARPILRGAVYDIWSAQRRPRGKG